MGIIFSLSISLFYTSSCGDKERGSPSEPATTAVVPRLIGGSVLVGPRRSQETPAADVLCPAIVQVSGRGALTPRPPVLALSRALVLPCPRRVYVDCHLFYFKFETIEDSSFTFFLVKNRASILPNIECYLTIE